MDRVKPRLATAWLGGCSGCHMSFLDLDERLIDLAGLVDVCYTPIADIKEFPEGVDIALVEGAVANEDHLRDDSIDTRAHKTLIAFGDCAVTGNVTALRNLFSVEDVLQRAYRESSIVVGVPTGNDIVPKLLKRVLRVQDVVQVDHFLPGCPPSADMIYNFVSGPVSGTCARPRGQKVWIMSRRIVIQPVTRIEGHAKISIQLDDAGQVESAKFHVTEFRGFEKLCEGRPFQEMPGLMSRVCGICPVSHVLASSKAGDMLLGVEIPQAAEKQRRLVNYAQVLQSHALSFFHLTSPDLLLGMDSPAAKRNIFGLLEEHADFLRKGIRLRQFGQRVIELVGGKRIHPGWSGPGGVHRQFTVESRDEILAWIPEAIDSVSLALDRLKSLLDSFRAEVEHMGNLPSLFLATVNDAGGLEYYEGTIRIVDGAGNAIAEGLDPKRYFTYLGEASVDYSFMKFALLSAVRLSAGTLPRWPTCPAERREIRGLGARRSRKLREFKERGAGAVCESFHYHLARLIEMLHCAERIEELMTDPELFEETMQAKASLNRREGIGSCEAPRGTLFHRYFVDKDGLMTRADLLIATAQNNQAMNLAVEQTARQFLTPPDGDAAADQGALNRIEAAIRCFDPCLSCSTHAMGQMPMMVEVVTSGGKLLRRLCRQS